MISPGIQWFTLLGIILAGAGYGLFVASAIAVTRSRESQVRDLVEARFPFATLAQKILSRGNDYVFASNIGLFFCTLFTGFCLFLLLRQPVEKSFSIASASSPIEIGTFLYVFILLAVVLMGILLISQVARLIAYSVPEKVLCLLSLPLITVTFILTPIISVLDDIVVAILRVLGLKVPNVRGLILSTEDLHEVVDRSALAGEIESDEQELLQGVVAFSDTVVREIMVPRKDIVTIHVADSFKKVRETFIDEGLSRLPVVGENLDDMQGILLARDLIPFLGKVPDGFSIKDYMRAIYRIPNKTPVDVLLQSFQESGHHFAVVQDEHGGVDGIITLEDLLEEIVGEITDEFDQPEEGHSRQLHHSGVRVFDGSLPIDDFNEMIPERIPEGEYDTLAGFIIHQLGRIPEVGDIVEYENVLLKVDSLDKNRIISVRVRLRQKRIRPEG